MIEYRKFGAERIEEIYEIYASNKWESYLGNKEKLIRAFERSVYVLGAFDNDRLIGFIRCVGDEEYILYVQDLIVHPSYWRKGIGSTLMKAASEHYPEIRQFLLITDADDASSNAFYQAIGLVESCKGFPVKHYFRK